jgi:hypothetical protein
MKTLDEMRELHLIDDDQHAKIAAWIAQSPTPEAIMQMPAPLWRTLQLASVLMGVDRDLTQAPALDHDA